VFFLTRGPAGILGRGPADILGAGERGEEGETKGEENSSMRRPARVGDGSGVGFMEPSAPWVPWERLTEVSKRGVRVCFPGRQAGGTLDETGLSLVSISTWVYFKKIVDVPGPRQD